MTGSEVSISEESETETAMSTTNVLIRQRRQAPGVERPRAAIAPVLDAPDSRLAAALARLGRGHPVRTFFIGIVIAYVAIARALDPPRPAA